LSQPATVSRVFYCALLPADKGVTFKWKDYRLDGGAK
jgi:hypothetical protein